MDIEPASASEGGTGAKNTLAGIGTDFQKTQERHSVDGNSFSFRYEYFEGSNNITKHRCAYKTFVDFF